MKKILFLGLVSLALVSFKSNAQSLSPSATSVVTPAQAKSSNSVRNLTTMVAVGYSSDTNSGGISQITLTPVGGGTSYTISNADLQSGTYTVLPGVYNAYVTTTGGPYNPTTHAGFGSFYYRGDGNASLVCNSYASTYSFELDLSASTYINFNIDYGDCN